MIPGKMVPRRVIDGSPLVPGRGDIPPRTEMYGRYLGEKRTERITIYRDSDYNGRLKPCTVIYLGKEYYVVQFENGIRESYYYHPGNPRAPAFVQVERERGKSLCDRADYNSKGK